jgi:hypothetical protein
MTVEQKLEIAEIPVFLAASIKLYPIANDERPRLTIILTTQQEATSRSPVVLLLVYTGERLKCPKICSKTTRRRITSGNPRIHKRLPTRPVANSGNRFW